MFYVIKSGNFKTPTFLVKKFRRNFIIKELQINDQIRSSQVRLIGKDGEQLGLLSAKEANRIADEQGLDLVEINPNGNPPVCKIMDYGKYKYELAQKEKEARKKQRESMTEIKGMRLGLGIGEHDLNFKAKQVIKFLKDGDKVKTTLRLRGRELSYANQAVETMNQFAELVAEYSVIEARPKLMGNIVSMVLAPKK